MHFQESHTAFGSCLAMIVLPLVGLISKVFFLIGSSVTEMIPMISVKSVN